jgi:hypothetical protein
MKIQNSRFAAPISANGYTWHPGPFHELLKDDVYNEPALIRIGNHQRVVQRPDDLFAEFSALASDDQIKHFADRFGLLGVRPRLSLFPQHPDKSTGEAITAELKSDWTSRIRATNKAIELWMGIKTENRELLAKCVKWAGAERIYYQAPNRPDGVAGDSNLIGLPAAYPPLKKTDDVIGWARICLEEMINDNLMPVVRFALPPAEESTGTFIRPTCLYGVLWYQLAQALSALKSVRPCDVCGKPMLVTPGGFRGERRTCSANCRMRIYDNRKLQARQLQQEGLPLQVIAKRLDTTVAQIERWTQVGTGVAKAPRARKRSARVAAAASS